MIILHGDARFYNNIFVQQPAPEAMKTFVRESGRAALNMLHLICGTLPYEGYPTEETYFARFTSERIRGDRAMYYDHLPVWMAGNVYCNGAQPCSADVDAVRVMEPVRLRLTQREDGWYLEMDLYDRLPATPTARVDSDRFGAAFESEQRFENPDGSFLTLDTDIRGRRRAEQTLPGPLRRRRGRRSGWRKDARRQINLADGGVFLCFVRVSSAYVCEHLFSFF